MFDFKKIVTLVTFLTSSMYGMQINYGYIISDNYSTSTFQYINNGTIKCLSSVNMDVSTLTGNGTISAPAISIKTGTLAFNGMIQTKDTCLIKAKKFEGAATISGSMITIICDEFNFTGSIECDKKCVIYVKEPFDKTLFKMNGKGCFTIVITDHDVEPFGCENLCIQAYNNLCTKSLSFNEDSVNKAIKKIRTDAALNLFDDKDVLKKIKNKIQQKIEFHKKRLDEKYDVDALHAGLTKCGISIAGFCIAYAIFKNDQHLSQKIDSPKALAGGIGIASLIPLGLSPSDFYQWLNPKHKERYEAFLLINARIDNALSFDRIKEEQIINL